MTRQQQSNQQHEKKYVNLFGPEASLCVVEQDETGKYREVKRFPPSEVELWVRYDDRTIRMIEDGLWSGPSSSSRAVIKNLPYRRSDETFIVSIGVADALRLQLLKSDWDNYLVPQGIVFEPESADPAVSFEDCVCCTKLVTMTELFGGKGPETAEELMGLHSGDWRERELERLLDGFADDFF